MREFHFRRNSDAGDSNDDDPKHGDEAPTKDGTYIRQQVASPGAKMYSMWKKDGSLEYPGGLKFLRVLFSNITHGLRDEDGFPIRPGTDMFNRYICAFLQIHVLLPINNENIDDMSIEDWITSGLAAWGMTNDETFCDSLKEEVLEPSPDSRHLVRLELLPNFPDPPGASILRCKCSGPTRQGLENW